MSASENTERWLRLMTNIHYGNLSASKGIKQPGHDGEPLLQVREWLLRQSPIDMNQQTFDSYMVAIKKILDSINSDIDTAKITSTSTGPPNEKTSKAVLLSQIDLNHALLNVARRNFTRNAAQTTTTTNIPMTVPRLLMSTKDLFQSANEICEGLRSFSRQERPDFTSSNESPGEENLDLKELLVKAKIIEEQSRKAEKELMKIKTKAESLKLQPNTNDNKMSHTKNFKKQFELPEIRLDPFQDNLSLDNQYLGEIKRSESDVIFENSESESRVYGSQQKNVSQSQHVQKVDQNVWKGDQNNKEDLLDMYHGNTSLMYDDDYAENEKVMYIEDSDIDFIDADINDLSQVYDERELSGMNNGAKFQEDVVRGHMYKCEETKAMTENITNSLHDQPKKTTNEQYEDDAEYDKDFSRPWEPKTGNMDDAQYGINEFEDTGSSYKDAGKQIKIAESLSLTEDLDTFLEKMDQITNPVESYSFIGDIEAKANELLGEARIGNAETLQDEKRNAREIKKQKEEEQVKKHIEASEEKAKEAAKTAEKKSAVQSINEARLTGKVIGFFYDEPRVKKKEKEEFQVDTKGEMNALTICFANLN